MKPWAPYMEWSKKRPAVKYDLAGSNLLSCAADDLPGFREIVELNGSNPDGYPPLLEAIARHYGVSVGCVAPGSGAGGANFVAMAALVRPGDDVLVERPGYDPMLAALRLLHLDDLRPQPGESLGAGRPGLELRQVEDLDAVQRWCILHRKSSRACVDLVVGRRGVRAGRGRWEVW